MVPSLIDCVMMVGLVYAATCLAELPHFLGGGTGSVRMVFAGFRCAMTFLASLRKILRGDTGYVTTVHLEHAAMSCQLATIDLGAGDVWIAEKTGHMKIKIPERRLRVEPYRHISSVCLSHIYLKCG